MEDFITEVQITCIVLMGLLTFILVYSLPRYSSAGKVLTNARKLLSIGTALITVHFIIQYFLHKANMISPEVRTVVNLLFGLPISYCFNFSLLYLQRKGLIYKKEYLFIAISYFNLILFFLGTYVFWRNSPASMLKVTFIMSLIYAVTLVYSYVLQFKAYRHIMQIIKKEKDRTLESLTLWTKWSMFIMALMGIGLPFMTFNNNLAMRSFYGILSISVAFFYVFSFIGYDLSQKNIKPKLRMRLRKKSVPVDTISPKPLLDEIKLKEVAEAIEVYVKSRHYMSPGITIKDVSAQVGVSRNVLNLYFQTTAYKKFNNWLTHLRIEEAKRLMLEHPDWSNEAVAIECGFSNRAYFQRQFSETEGISPAKWIKEHQRDSKKEK